MKKVIVEQLGPPPDVVKVIEVDEPGAPGPHEALVELVGSPIHPSDLLTIAGQYAGAVPLPLAPGKEGAGKVLAVGNLVRHLKPGDVVPIARPDNGVWQERQLLPAESLVALPPGGNLQQYSMMIVNPGTAYLLLHSIVPLELGDWVVQNAANSAVGQYLIRLARRAGFRTINVVRRASLADELHAIGADVVLVDGDDLAERVNRATGGAKIKLAIDAIAGTAARRLSECLADGGTLCNYGALSGEDVRISPAQLIGRGVVVRGFWLTAAMAQSGVTGRQKLFSELIPLVASGELEATVEALYPLDRVREAVAHAGREGRSGKVLLTR